MTIMIKTLVRYMLNAHNAYNDAGMMIALYFVALLIIAFFCKDKALKKLIILPSVFLIFVNYVLIPIYDTFVEYFEFYDGRFFWLLLTPIVIAVGFTIFVDEIEDKKNRVMALILLIPMLLLCGEFQISNAMFKKVSNPYRLPQCTVDITEHITSEMEEPKIMVPYTIAHPFRQITTDIKLLYGEDASFGRIVRTTDELIDVCEEMEHVTPDLNFVIPVARKHDVDYVLFDTVYTELCEDGNINIYNYPIDENYVGDRTSTVSFDDLKDVSVIDDEEGIYWDLSAYGLTYDGTFGQYILYRLDK